MAFGNEGLHLNFPWTTGEFTENYARRPITVERIMMKKTASIFLLIFVALDMELYSFTRLILGNTEENTPWVVVECKDPKNDNSGNYILTLPSCYYTSLVSGLSLGQNGQGSYLIKVKFNYNIPALNQGIHNFAFYKGDGYNRQKYVFCYTCEVTVNNGIESYSNFVLVNEASEVESVDCSFWSHWRE